MWIICCIKSIYSRWTAHVKQVRGNKPFCFGINLKVKMLQTRWLITVWWCTGFQLLKPIEDKNHVDTMSLELIRWCFTVLRGRKASCSCSPKRIYQSYVAWRLSDPPWLMEVYGEICARSSCNTNTDDMRSTSVSETKRLVSESLTNVHVLPFPSFIHSFIQLTAGKQLFILISSRVSELKASLILNVDSSASRGRRNNFITWSNSYDEH